MDDMESLLRAEIASIGETEWNGTIGGKSVTLRSGPITPADVTIIERKHPGFTSSPSVGGMIAMIIRKARDTNGQLAFKQHHQEFLQRLPVSFVGEIFAGLFGEQFEDLFDPDGEKHEARVGN